MSLEINSSFDSLSNKWNVSLTGELDVSNSDKLKDALQNLIKENLFDINLDLSKLKYIDSTGIGVIIAIFKKLKLENKQIFICNPQKNVKKIFSITGLDIIFKMEG